MSTETARVGALLQRASSARMAQATQTEQPCSLCGQRRVALLELTARDGSALKSVVCLGCGLVRSDPIPSEAELRSFYRSSYRSCYKGVREPKLKHVARAGKLAVARYRRISRYFQPGGRVLDIGCGGGEWLYLLKRTGIPAIGIEADPHYAGFARTMLGVDVQEASLCEASFSAESFPLITLFHVLEHLHNPVEALRQCLGWLRSGGHLVVEVPNLASHHQHPSTRFHRAHLHGFVPLTLALAGRKAGAHLVELKTDRFDRNITAVFQKSSSPEPFRLPSGEQVSTVVSTLRKHSIVAYYSSPVTYARFALRISQFAREQAATCGKKHPRQVLDTAMRDVAGLLSPSDRL